MAFCAKWTIFGLMDETFTAKQFFAELEEIGEDEVRLRLITKIYSSTKYKKELAEEWLRLQEDRRRLASEASAARRSERMINSARVANIIAIVAAIIAIVAATKAI